MCPNRKCNAAFVVLVGVVLFGAEQVTADINMSNIPANLVGTTLRVAYFEFAPAVEKNADGTHQGWMVDLLKDLESKAGFTIQETAISQESLTLANGGLQDACVFDVRDEKLDVCVGLYWETATHRELAAFTSVLIVESFMLQTVATTSATIAEDMAHVFTPFMPELWATILAAIIATSLILFVFERNGSSEDYDADMGVLGNSFTAVYQGAVGLLSGGPINAPKTFAGKMTLIGFGFYVLVVTASYTANLAAFLTVSGISTQFASIDDVIANAGTVCVHDDLSNELLIQYPSLSVVGKPDDVSVSQGVFDGSCDAAVQNVQEFQNIAKNQLCNLAFVGSTITSVPVAWPVVGEFESTLSYWLARARGNGYIKAERDKWKATAQCATGSTSSSQQLTVRQMSGVFITLCVTVAIAAVVHVLEHLHARSKVAAADGVVTDIESKAGADDKPTTKGEAFSGGDLEALQLLRTMADDMQALKAKVAALER